MCVGLPCRSTSSRHRLQVAGCLASNIHCLLHNTADFSLHCCIHGRNYAAPERLQDRRIDRPLHSGGELHSRRAHGGAVVLERGPTLLESCWTCPVARQAAMPLLLLLLLMLMLLLLMLLMLGAGNVRCRGTSWSPTGISHSISAKASSWGAVVRPRVTRPTSATSPSAVKVPQGAVYEVRHGPKGHVANGPMASWTSADPSCSGCSPVGRRCHLLSCLGTRNRNAPVRHIELGCSSSHGAMLTRPPGLRTLLQGTAALQVVQAQGSLPASWPPDERCRQRLPCRDLPSLPNIMCRCVIGLGVPV